MTRLDTMDCEFPETLADALELMADDTTRGVPLSGGTDLMVQWAGGVVAAPQRVISLAGLPELKGITLKDQCVVVGAGTTHAELRASEVIQARLPALAAAAATVGAQQIQARGTIGGNVANASPAGDLAPALVITGGAVVVAGVHGERRVNLTDFFKGYRSIDLRADELIVRFELPVNPDGSREMFRKIGTRSAQAISKIMAACRIRIEDRTIRSVALAVGSVAPTVIRLTELEAWLTGRVCDEDTIAEAVRRTVSAVSPIDDIRSTAAYREWVSGSMIRGFLDAFFNAEARERR
ncbi:MAG: hypothetical protein EOM20_12340 [Spartobacteria bacterium]|nr:hypothetical protein [Spartobacteria bacterium]